MSRTGRIYARALYSLAKDEALCNIILDELKALDAAISGEADFLCLLTSAAISKDERIGIVDELFCGRVHPYVLSFIKILTENGCMRCFGDCCRAYRELYNEDNGILPVTAVAAAELSAEQTARLTEKLARMTGKTIELELRIDPSCIGGIRLDYGGMRMDGTVAQRLEDIRSILQNTVL